MNLHWLGLLTILLSFMSFFLMKVIWTRRKTVIDRAVSLAWQAAGIPTYRQSLPKLRKELARARRYHRPLTIIVLGWETDQLLEQKRRSISEGSNGNPCSPVQLEQRIAVAFHLLSHVLRRALRESDIVTYDALLDQYVIGLVEVNKFQAMRCARRLKDLAFKRTLVHLRAGRAEFPVDGLTIDDLVSTAQAACNHEPEAAVWLGSAAREKQQSQSSVATAKRL